MSWSAGFIDAVSYLELNRIYTSHMTGNTATFASNVWKGDWHEAIRFGWTIVCFLIGLLISALMTHAERRQGIRSAFAAALGLEVLLLVLYIWLGQEPFTPEAVLIFLPAAAMGIQTVTVTRIGTLRIYTTYLTATLSKFSEAVAQYLFWFWDRTRGRFRKRFAKVLLVTPRQISAKRAVVTALLWIAFFIGAVCGVAGDHRWKLVALGMPILPLCAAIGIDLNWPAALGERFRPFFKRPEEQGPFFRPR
jgi:uncharacterized membrane protein YoaK (UPF0700 family)